MKHELYPRNEKWTIPDEKWTEIAEWGMREEGSWGSSQFLQSGCSQTDEEILSVSPNSCKNVKNYTQKFEHEDQYACRS